MSVSEDWIIYFFMHKHFKKLWSITSSILSVVNKNTQVYLGCSKFLLWICLEIKQQSNILIRKWFCIYDKIYKKNILWQTISSKHANEIDEIMNFSCWFFLVVCIYLCRTDIFVKEMEIYRVRSYSIFMWVVFRV